jgi:hypothetical protein
MLADVARKNAKCWIVVMTAGVLTWLVLCCVVPAGLCTFQAWKKRI